MSFKTGLFVKSHFIIYKMIVKPFKNDDFMVLYFFGKDISGWHWSNKLVNELVSTRQSRLSYFFLFLKLATKSAVICLCLTCQRSYDFRTLQQAFSDQIILTGWLVKDSTEINSPRKTEKILIIIFPGKSIWEIHCRRYTFVPFFLELLLFPFIKRRISSTLPIGIWKHVYEKDSHRGKTILTHKTQGYNRHFRIWNVYLPSTGKKNTPTFLFIEKTRKKLLP